jgi:shikimate dehydrogenase
MDRYAVIGNPVSHSLSPHIHSLFAQQTHQLMTYDAQLVEIGNLQQSLALFQSQGGKGLNITMPFKQETMQFVDTLSDRAARAGAINTIKFNADGIRYGDNTDGVGLIRDIEMNHYFQAKDKKILVIGAGGAVRGIIPALLEQAPAKVVVINRTEEKAQKLVNDFQTLGNITLDAFLKLKHNRFDLIVNGTSASTQGAELFMPALVLAPEGFCYDLSYANKTTAFSEWAAKQGARYANGLGMLIEQAAESFYLWRGVKPDTAPVLLALKKELGAQDGA